MASNVAGGTGSGGNASDFLAQITSYDYSAPISEAGGTGQPGIGGNNKFEACGCNLPYIFKIRHCLLRYKSVSPWICRFY